jgi:hypothetical protein
MEAGPIELLLSLSAGRGRLLTMGRNQDYVTKVIFDPVAAQTEFTLSQAFKHCPFVSAPSSLTLCEQYALVWSTSGHEKFVQSWPVSVLAEKLVNDFEVRLDQLVLEYNRRCYGINVNKTIVPCTAFAQDFKVGFLITNFANLTIPYHGQDVFMLMTTGMKMEEKLELAVKMIRCVQKFHSTTHAHRDIKLENFLVHDGQVRLCDLEFSVYCKPGDRVRRSVTGTEWYLAPELHVALELDKNGVFDFDPYKSDLWSLGITIVSLIIERFPFNQPSKECSLFRLWEIHGNQLLLDKAQLLEPDKQRVKAVLDCLLNVDPTKRQMPDMQHMSLL